MLTLTHTELVSLTGAELLAQVANQQARQNGDLKIGDQTWRVYKSTFRGAHNGVWFHLWREVPNGATRPESVHIRGMVEQRIGEMEQVQQTSVHSKVE